MNDPEEVSQWERDCRAELAMDHENEVFLKFVILANFLGYQKVAFGLELPTSAAAPAFFMFCNFCDDWQEKFVERHVRHHGSRVAYGKRTKPTAEHEGKYYWERADFLREIQVANITPELYEYHEGEGASLSFVALAQHPHQGGARLNQKVRILIDAVRASMRRILVGKHLPQANIILTPAERLYMAWVLDGKTAGEIADIMGMSKPAIENLQRKLPDRFGMKGITATAFLAFRLGLLRVDPDAAADVE